MVRCDSKNRYQKDMSLKEIELRAQKYANQCSLNSEYYWGGGGPI